jgi:hypothetical protein
MERNFDQIIEQAEQAITLPESVYNNNTDQLQRTREWRESRLGKIGSSEAKKLMTCDQSNSKKVWGKPEKTIAFGKTALKMCYQKARERETGKVIETADPLTFKYGRAAEPIIKELLTAKLGAQIEIIEKPFVLVAGYEDYLGASSDGELGMGYIKKSKVRKGLEIKASMNFDTEYDRIVANINESHPDFWQLQDEMLALSVNSIMYVTAEPPESVIDFLNCDDPEEQKKMIGHIEVQEVHASPLHQKELLKRAIICRRIGDDYIETGDFNRAVERVLSDFEIEDLEI